MGLFKEHTIRYKFSDKGPCDWILSLKSFSSVRELRKQLSRIREILRKREKNKKKSWKQITTLDTSYKQKINTIRQGYNPPRSNTVKQRNPQNTKKKSYLNIKI